MRAGAGARRVEITISRHTIALTQEELGRLLRGLEALDVSEATSVAEEISELHRAGLRIQLLPSEAELRALIKALRAVEPISRSGSALTRLRNLCEESHAGV
jgi:hypothetical protein